MFKARKLYMVLAVGTFYLSLAAAASATSIVVNGDFATDASGWTMLNTTSSDTRLNAVYYATTGYPAGSVKLERADMANATNGHRYYQFIPVVPGTKYYVRAQWKGDLSLGTTGSGWAEMYIGFTADANTAQPSWSSILRYKKSWDGVNNVNVGSSGQWNWENVTTSPSGTPPESFTAQTGQNYMIVAFNLGGTAMANPSLAPYVFIDNVVVVACNNLLPGDANLDCRVNFVDMGIVASQWLTCNLDPATSCW